MHMADALISPVVGGTMWVAAIGTAAYSIKKLKNETEDKMIPLMGVMGAFVFAAQMINFTIPGTGSSGHIGGGMLLAILLGPYAGFLTMASILTIQALFFADGGLLALGSTMINLGFFTCFVTYPLLYKPLIKEGLTTKKIYTGAMLSSVIGLQLGSLGVVLQTVLSGRTELPLGTFLLFMQPIHLAIGIGEGLITAAVVVFLWKARPEIIEMDGTPREGKCISMKRVLVGSLIITLLIGGVVSWFASSNPDGLEWAILKVTGSEELEAPKGIYQALALIQEKTALLPDYDFRSGELKNQEYEEESTPIVNGGTSAAGIIGGGMTLVLAGLTGFLIKLMRNKKKALLSN